MSKYLVIVESPTKEKTISKILGPDFIVKSSWGHVRDLPKKELGVDVNNDFKPRYIFTPKAKKILAQLKLLSRKSQFIYLATDYDREGEAIAWHLKESLKLPDEKIKRITFHEITSEAIKEAIKHSRQINPDLVDSQQARRVLDRLVGYELSPLLWHKIRYGLSAGRVQSVAVRMICDREEEIDKFKPQEYWTLQAELKKNKSEKESFRANLVAKGEQKFDKLDIKDKQTIDKIVSDLKNASYSIINIEAKERLRSPYPPYTTSTLQQDASRKLHFSAAKTMMVAQKLYEGIKLGQEGNVGLITYMRTDSVNMAEPFRKEAQKLIERKYGKKYLPEKPRIYKTKTKGAQEAHEAIRPTSCMKIPEEIKKYLANDEYKLYDLIWRRAVACQMANALYDTLAVDIKANDYLFRANGRTLKFNGFLEVYTDNEDNGDEQKDMRLPVLSVGERLYLVNLLSEQHFTEPPPRFNEASLIKALEEYGIGRPSTYAPIMHTIIVRGYVRLDQRRFFPTDLGRLVNEVLKTHFTEIVDLEFTARVEKKLDQIALGNVEWNILISDFYKPFKKNISLAEKNMTRQKVKPQKTNEICPKCGKPMVIRESRRGRFLACTGFPQCRTTFSVDKNNQKIVKPEPEITDKKCEKCGKMMLKRIGKRGPFLACSGFPKCRNTKKITEQK